jgi:hypothetical protein
MPVMDGLESELPSLGPWNVWHGDKPWHIVVHGDKPYAWSHCGHVWKMQLICVFHFGPLNTYGRGLYIMGDRHACPESDWRDPT